ncbi:hypothetical protein DS2_06971 [Catenovulum agarivorans DS-2]|uniref:Uncharacterized protein n=1 Tax=Catenovulum agarivorans DS-2 TaxID=1328313 RepID=W7QSD5_9ALTE|nr:hypothetical protein [Catenovulum agarivorans]EWH10773.1 hypothetical protein DS2_06971 [Catenovulum agarivorans DS-2]
MNKKSVELTPFQQLTIDVQQGKVEESIFIAEFLNTKFHIAIHKKFDEKKPTFDYLVYQSKQTENAFTVVISEDESYIKNMGASDILFVKGGDIIKSLHPNLEITIAFNGGGIGMTVDKVNFLKQNVQFK